MGAPVEELEPLEDPRRGNAGRHSLHDILVTALCTILCGGETCTGMALFGQSKREFLESFLPLRIGIPGHDAFSRVFRLPDPDEFQKWFLGFMRQFAQGCEGVPAVDGKTLRRSYDRAEAEPPLRLVSAWAAEQRPALGQLAVVFNEDQSRNRKDHCPDNLALLRKLALNLARLEPSKGSIRGKLKRSGWDNDYLVIILSQFTKIQMR